MKLVQSARSSVWIAKDCLRELIHPTESGDSEEKQEAGAVLVAQHLREVSSLLKAFSS